MSHVPWQWDESLYAGSASYYSVGRTPYPESIADALRDELGLDGTGRLLDVGCGPGSLTLLLAPLFASAVGVDADAGMLEEARARAARAGLSNLDWYRLRAEDLPADLGPFRVVTFAQSFHWMDRSLVAERVRGLLAPDGAWVHVGATTSHGVDVDGPLPHPRPPWDAIEALVIDYLGTLLRAGQGTLPRGNRSGEEDVMRAAGYAGPTRIEVDHGRVLDRSADEIVASVFSLSRSAPHLFGDRLPAFEADLRALLVAASPGGRFSEIRREMALVIWRP
jgi:SAM-dependent methyltransferase